MIKRTLSALLFIANLQILITMLWVAFGDINILTNNADKLWNKYMIVSLFIYPSIDTIYFFVKMVRNEREENKNE